MTPEERTARDKRSAEERASRPLAEVYLTFQCKTLDVGNHLWWPGNRDTEGEIARSTVVGPMRMEPCANAAHAPCSDPEHASPAVPMASGVSTIFAWPESMVSIELESPITPVQHDAVVTAVAQFLEALPEEIREAAIHLARSSGGGR